MKSIKSLIIASAFAVGIVSTASAQTVIDITGSTAFRSSVHAAIVNSLNSPKAAYQTGSGVSLDNASYAVFKGTLKSNSASVVIRVAWTGSAQGVKDLATPNSINFLPDTAADSAATPTISGGKATGGTGTAAAANSSSTPELAFSDVYQGSTDSASLTSLGDSIVAVVPFKFIVGHGAAAKGVTNMTPQLFSAIWTKGYQPIALFGSTDPNASTTYVIPTGRNNESGTRITTFAETGFGINNPSVIQYPVIQTGADANGYGGTGALDSAFSATGGYDSGSKAAKAVTADLTAGNSYMITYLGLGDASNALGTGSTPALNASYFAEEMTYNGSLYSAANVSSGKYTMWGYEHLYAPTTASGNIAKLRDDLTSAINTAPGSSGLNSASVLVSRSTDGGTVAY